MNLDMLRSAGVALALLAAPMAALSQDQQSAAETQVSGMFDPSAWMNQGQSATAPGSYDWSSMGSAFAVPQGVPQLNMATPNGMSAFMNPAIYAQMMNPAMYAQMMSPGFYMQFVNPANWMSWLDPSAYSNWLNPQTYLQAMNPMSYMPFMNPLTYMQWLNLNNYGAFVNPGTYTQWFDPSAYRFQAPATAGGAGINWFDPATWTDSLGAGKSE